MMVFSVSGLLLGALLALRFKVLILVPVTLIGIATYSLLGIVSGRAISPTDIFSASIALDAGYLGVTFIFFVASPAFRSRGLASSAFFSKPAL